MNSPLKNRISSALLKCLAVILAACHNPDKENQTLERQPVDTSESVIMSSHKLGYKKSDCVRGIPSPIIKSDSMISSHFVLSADSSIGNEWGVNKWGDTLFVEHSGCEWLTTIFRFPYPFGLNHNVEYETEQYRIRDSFREVLKTVNVGTEMPRGLQALYKMKGFDQVGKEIDYSTDIIQDLVSIDSIKLMPDGKPYAWVRFSRGPL